MTSLGSWSPARHANTAAGQTEKFGRYRSFGLLIRGRGAEFPSGASFTLKKNAS
jgi:hypothetical protein